jgi:hypothetical protein
MGQSEISALLHGGLYQTDTVHLNKRTKYIEWRFWMLPLALYTGMRQMEIAQLHIDDLKSEKGIFYLHVNDDDGGDKSEGQPTSTGRRVRYRTGASVKGLPPAKKNRVVRRKMAAIERALKELREVAGWSGVCMLGLPVTDKETQYQQLFSPDMCLRVHDIDPLRQEFFAAMRAKYPDIPDMEMQPQPGRLFVRQGMETGPALACYNVSIETLRIMQSVGGTCRQIVNDMAGNGSAPDFLSPGK